LTERKIVIDPRAVVEEDADIGTGSSVWHFAHIRGGSKIGEKCVIGKDVYVDKGVKIGNRCKVQNGVSIYNGVVIGDDVFVGPHAVFTNDLKPRANIWNEEKLEKTIVEDGASIGANATIRCGVTLGKWCMIGAGSVVTKDVPPHALILGVPGKIVDWVTITGERLNLDLDEGFRGGDFYCKKSGEKVFLASQGVE